MAQFYVDLTAGNDAGSGSIGNPYKTFQPINNAAAWNGNQILVKRGSSGVVNAGTRANIIAAASCDVTAYGDAASNLPLISGGGVNHNPVWVHSGANITIANLHVSLSAGDGLCLIPDASATLNNISVTDCLVTENNQLAIAGSDGLKCGLNSTNGGAITNVTLRRVIARDNIGHGIKFRGNVDGARAIDCVALRCGLGSASHGMGTSGQLTVITNQTWTNVGTAGGFTVWERAVSGLAIDPVTNWKNVYVLGASPLYSLTLAGTPSAPLPGEFGIGANNTIRINLEAVNPNVCTVSAAYAIPKNVHFIRCIGAYTNDSNGVEGQGIYFDNGNEQCYSIDCAAILNDGHGFYLNDAHNSSHLCGISWMNGKGGTYAARGGNVNYHGMRVACTAGTPGMYFAVGVERARVRCNVIVGATTAIAANDLATNDVSEDENLFVNCDTATSNIQSVGARSSSTASNAYTTMDSFGGEWVARRIATAEAVL